MSIRAALGLVGKRLSRSRLVVVTAGILMAIALAAVLGPLLSPHNYLDADFDGRLLRPALADMHLFGTDDLGRDLFVRSMLGVQVTLVVAPAARRRPG